MTNFWGRSLIGKSNYLTARPTLEIFITPSAPGFNCGHTDSFTSTKLMVSLLNLDTIHIFYKLSKCYCNGSSWYLCDSEFGKFS